MQRHRPPSDSRAGLSLLEVLLATAIFIGSLVAIMQSLRIGADNEISARMDSEAALRCEAVMAELVAGVRGLESAADQAFDDGAANWFFDVQVEDAGVSGLLKLTVTVRHSPNEGVETTSVSLDRYLRDPQLFIDAAASASGDG